MSRARNAEIAERAKKRQRARGPAAVRAVNPYAARIKKITEELSTKLVADETVALVTNEGSWFGYIELCMDYGAAGIKVHTNGLDIIDDTAVGVSLYVPGHPGIYAPTGHTDVDGNVLPYQVTSSMIKDGLEKLVRQKVKLAFENASFDQHMILNAYGVFVPAHWDVIYGMAYLDENYSPRKLKPMWNHFCNSDPEQSVDTLDSLFDGLPFNYVPYDVAYLYAAKDPKKIYELYRFQSQYLDPDNEKCHRKGLERAGQFFMSVEMPLVRYVTEMERTGVIIDKDLAGEFSEKYNTKAKRVKERITAFLDRINYEDLPDEKYKKLDKEININSPAQLAIVIYDVLAEYSVDEENPRGTGEEVLKALIEEGSPYSEFYRDILEFRTLSKLTSSYIDKLPRIAKEKTGGRVHGHFNQLGAVTGRFSSEGPNLQNIPNRGEAKEIRKVFQASPGHVLISADYSQQEPRILAHLAQDEEMIRAYRMGLDLYSWIASEVYGVPYEDCLEYSKDGTTNPAGKQRRFSMKEIVLGIIYGRGTASIADKLEIPWSEADRIKKLFFNRFSNVRATMDYWLDYARKNGFVYTLYGRKRRLPDIQLPRYEFYYSGSNEPIEPMKVEYYTYRLEEAREQKKNERKRFMADIRKELRKQSIFYKDNSGRIAYAERQCLNSIIQGTGAEITKRGMLAISTSVELRELRYRMLMTVHDEIDGEVPRENALKAKRIIQRLMIDASDIVQVPMKVDVDISERWNGEDITEILKNEQSA